ncbi:MAG: hypothetical protein A2V91_03355 [Candidatus Muproteobacteria bacterium RBG_16_64_10]|uniref:Uncharacterized protein n=1 Tax=Candidatus Muproteobacteria bacterium RBG_16_64_10 TaxID=1817757 RepID=A0A1F6T3U7_9PROT|nr:MAG: hypothetical protein A2V91_03355 [Candidatus Muproteobacteria bacterium RBG_16_64_10]
MNPNRPDGGRTLVFAMLIFLGLLAVEAGLLAAAVGRLPNDVAAPLADQFAMLVTLWRSNPMAALPHLAQQAVIVIAHREPATGQQVWGLYYYPLTLIVHLAVAGVAARMLAAPMGRRRLALLAAGGAALVIGVTYVRLAACCTVTSRWALDIALLAQAYDPTSTWLDWQALYAPLEPAFPYLQAGTLAAGIGLSVAAWRRRPRAAGD